VKVGDGRALDWARVLAAGRRCWCSRSSHGGAGSPRHTSAGGSNAAPSPSMARAVSRTGPDGRRLPAHRRPQRLPAVAV